MTGESLEEVFSRLSVSEDERMEVMEVMGPLLQNSDGDMTKRIENLDLNVLFVILGSASSQEELVLACKTLKELLYYLKPSFILERYTNALEAGLAKSTHVQVKILVLKTLQRMKPHEVGSYKSILSLATSTIADPELSLAKETMNFLINISSGAIDLIFSDSIYPLLQDILEEKSRANMVNQLRVYELFIKIGSISDELLNRIVEAQILNRFLKMAYSDDILVKLNVLELLGDLARTSQGYKYIVKDSGISSQLDDLLDVDNALSNIVLPGTLNFFANLAYIEPKLIFANHPKFLNFLTSGVKRADGNDTIYRASIESIGVIVKTTKGKEAVNEIFDVVEILGPIAQDIRKGTTEVRIAALDIFADFVNSDSSKEWFQLLGKNPELPAESVLLQMLQLPFPEVQSSAYRVLLTISRYFWGARIVAEYPGFMEFLLNRDTARTKEIKERKYEVIQGMLSTGDADFLVQVFGTPGVIKMKEYVRDGPFYVKSEANVAYEEA